MDGHDPPGGDARAPDGPPLAGPSPALAGESAPAFSRRSWDLLAVIVTATAGFVGMSAGQLAAAIALGIGPRAPTERTPLDILLVTCAGAVALLLVLVALSPRLLHTDLRGLGFRAPSAGEVRFALTAALGLWVLSILVNLVSIAIFGPNPQPLVVSFGEHRGAVAIALDLLTGAAVAPLAEETLYRGILFAGLAQRLPFPPAALISGVLFAIPHGIGVFAPILVLGTGLAWIYARTGTLWAPILAHAVVNAISLGILFIAA